VTHHIKAFLLLFCAVSVAVVLQSQAAEAAEGQPDEVKRIALSHDGKTIEVQAPDAWENPYRGQYSEWDYWVWERYDPTITLADYGT